MAEVADPQFPTPPSAASRRRGPRFSLLSLVLLSTIVALAIGLYRTGQEVVPLRASITRLRKEIGYFPVDDESQVHVRRSSVKIPTAWEWRISLPTPSVYSLRFFAGEAPDPTLVGRGAWFQFLRAQSRPLGEIDDGGEFGYEALLTEYDGRPWLRAGRLAEQGVTFDLPPRNAWLLAETSWRIQSDASYDEVRTFVPAEPVVLLHIERSIHDRDDAGDGPKFADDGRTRVNERFVIWLEVQTPPTTTAGFLPGVPTGAPSSSLP
jgi:hypothetical protein